MRSCKNSTSKQNRHSDEHLRPACVSKRNTFQLSHANLNVGVKSVKLAAGAINLEKFAKPLPCIFKLG
jgi:hypothetical protein